MAKNLYADHTHSIADICKSLGISRATSYRYLDVPADATDTTPSTALDDK
jgi:ACT domain-containing protein